MLKTRMDAASKLMAFIEELQKSLENGEFLKLALGNYRGVEPELKKIVVKPVSIKNQTKLSFTYKYKTRDIVKNYSYAEGLEKIISFVNIDFFTALLSLSGFDFLFENNKGKIIFKKTETNLCEAAVMSHDKQKRRLIDARQTYLQDLSLTDKNGAVFKNAQDKFRQINRYIELLEPLLKTLPKKKIQVADMGSGKGYLTFALYDFLQQTGYDAAVTGVEYRSDMVELCNQIAEKSGFDDLTFIRGSIESYTSDKIDMLVALHACDTATDDAIFKGIAANADLIVVAPCCHKEIRREMEKGRAVASLDFMTRYGIFLERQAEMVTDGLRALMLEYCGYKVKIFEFISGEHTAKNIMITAMRDNKLSGKNAEVLKHIRGIMTQFDIQSHHLAKLLKL